MNPFPFVQQTLPKIINYGRRFGLLASPICLLWLLLVPEAMMAQTSTTAVIQPLPAIDINQLAADYEATVTGSIPTLSYYRLQAANPNLLTELAADDRVLVVQAEATLDARPRWIDATGHDLLSPQGDPFVAANPPPAAFTDQWAGQRIRTTPAHNLVTGAGIIVAVLDTGVDLDHPWLADKLLPGYDFVDNDALPAEEANGLDSDGDMIIDEALGHGSHVAGIIALTAPDAQLLPIRIFNSDGVGRYFDIAQGIIYAVDHGAQVINLSGSGPDNSPYLQAAIDYAQLHGVVVVSAGGLNTLEYPGTYAGVISVGAADAADYAQPFADYDAESVTIFAPGASIFSAYYDDSAVGWSGNSMAAPFVAGAAALLRSTGQCDNSCVYDRLTAETLPPVWRNGRVGSRLDLVDVLTAVLPAAPHLSLQYQIHPADTATDDSIQPFLKIQNDGQTIALTDLTVRYWYQTDTPVTEIFHCDYALIGCNRLTYQFAPVAGIEGTNRTFELGFTGTAGYLYGGTDSGDLIFRVNQNDNAPYAETTHYSYAPTLQTYTDWDKVTLYYQGELVWGIEPGQVDPPSPPPPPPSCTNADWNPDLIYVAGDEVAHNGLLYHAKWWTTNEEPGTTGPWGVWEDLGPCP